jgi:UDP-N-acetylmuramate dehydrogenase
MKIFKNHALQKHNTFGIKATAAAFVKIRSVKDLKAVLTTNALPIQLLGGGSNMLFTKDFYDCLFIKNAIMGIKIVENAVYTEGSFFELKIKNSKLSDTDFELKIKNSKLKTTDSDVENANFNAEEGSVIVEIGGGEQWHDVVLWAIKNNLGGIENLSLIPGTVGAAPIQNIGAYGVELKNVFHKLEAFNLQTLKTQTFTAEDCQFGYRESVFKHQLKGQFLITRVFLKLRTPQYHALNLKYGDIQKTLAERGIEKPTIKDISDAVISIRQSKLPDPNVIGNAGSFFKNPEIPLAQFNELKTKFPLIVGYPTTNDTVKVAAGWLIENTGWKGKRFGNVGVHEKQALVLVNYGGGKGLEIKALAKVIQKTVLDKFGIELMAEVNWI